MTPKKAKTAKPAKKAKAPGKKKATHPRTGPRKTPYPLTPGRNPWERQKRETGKAWEAFLTYRTMGPARTYVDVARELGKVESQIRRWAHLWRWIDRVELWDREQLQRLESDDAAALAEMKARHRDQAKSLQGIGLAKFAEFVGGDGKIKTSELANVSVTEARRLIAEGVRMERMTYGEATDPDSDVESIFDLVASTEAETEGKGGGD